MHAIFKTVPPTAAGLVSHGGGDSRDDLKHSTSVGDKGRCGHTLVSTVPPKKQTGAHVMFSLLLRDIPHSQPWFYTTVVTANPYNIKKNSSGDAVEITLVVLVGVGSPRFGCNCTAGGEGGGHRRTET